MLFDRDIQWRLNVQTSGRVVIPSCRAFHFHLVVISRRRRVSFCPQIAFLRFGVYSFKHGELLLCLSLSRPLYHRYEQRDLLFACRVEPARLPKVSRSRMLRSRKDRWAKGGCIGMALVRLLSVWRSYPYRSKLSARLTHGTRTGQARRVGEHNSVLVSRIVPWFPSSHTHHILFVSSFFGLFGCSRFPYSLCSVPIQLPQHVSCGL